MHVSLSVSPLPRQQMFLRPTKASRRRFDDLIKQRREAKTTVMLASANKVAHVATQKRVLELFKAHLRIQNYKQRSADVPVFSRACRDAKISPFQLPTIK